MMPPGSPVPASAALYTVSDPDALRAEALAKAIEQARKTAEISAKATSRAAQDLQLLRDRTQESPARPSYSLSGLTVARLG
jgi:uncharacterized protein YggE